MNYLLLFLSCLTLLSCSSQTKCSCENCKTEYYVPNIDEEAYNFKAKDTLKKQLSIYVTSSNSIENVNIEKDIIVMVDGIRISKDEIRKIDAGHCIGVVVNYNNYSSCVSISIASINFTTNFQIKKGYRYLQIFVDKPERGNKLMYSNYQFL